MTLPSAEWRRAWDAGFAAGRLAERGELAGEDVEAEVVRVFAQGPTEPKEPRPRGRKASRRRRVPKEPEGFHL